jgi:hypothetical protein
MRRLLGHAPAAAARADGPRLTRERHQPLEPTGVAPHAREAPLERAAPEEGTELALDEAGDAGAVGGSGDLGE